MQVTLTDKELRSILRWAGTTQTLSTLVVGGDFANEPELLKKIAGWVGGVACPVGETCNSEPFKFKTSGYVLRP